MNEKRFAIIAKNNPIVTIINIGLSIIKPIKASKKSTIDFKNNLYFTLMIFELNPSIF
jgi:hypothetical protein